MSYAEYIIDEFVAELEGDSGPKEDAAASWRSRVLNPILQRQFHGLLDHEGPMMAENFTEFKGTRLAKAVEEFYLKNDPLDPELQPALRRGILYTTEYRWFLGITGDLVTDVDHYESCRITTKRLLAALADTDEEASVQEGLQLFELMAIVGENLEGYYMEDIELAVSSILKRRGSGFPG